MSIIARTVSWGYEPAGREFGFAHKKICSLAGRAVAAVCAEEGIGDN